MQGHPPLPLKRSFALASIDILLSHPLTYAGFIYPFHLSNIYSLCFWCTYCSAIKAFQVGRIASTVPYSLIFKIFFNFGCSQSNTTIMLMVNMQGVIAHGSMVAYT